MLRKLCPFFALLFTAAASDAQICSAPVYPSSCSNGYYIKGVTTTGGTLNIASTTNSCDNPSTNYVYFTGAGKILQADAGTAIRVKIEYAAPPNYLQRSAFWIDWNQDGFDNVYNIPGTTTGDLINTNPQSDGSVAGNPAGFLLTIPMQAKHGLTRMRVRSFASEQKLPPLPIPGSGTPPMDACLTDASIFYGETEDYDVFINNPCTKVNGIVFTEITSKGADVKWKPKGNEKQFEYVVDKNPGNPGNGNTFIPGTTSSMHIPDAFMKYIDCDAQYYLHIRAVCDISSGFPGSYYYGPWTTESFVTPPCCSTPTVDVKNITSYTASASWGPVKSVQMYEYMISINNIPPTGGTKIVNNAVALNGLQCSKEYYFFLRALCSPTPTSDWIVDSFLTQPCLSIDNKPGMPEFKLNAYPNPVKDVVTLSVMHGMKMANATIIVTDLTGKVLMTKVMTGDAIELDMHNVPAGLYLVKYADGERTQVAKINKE